MIRDLISRLATTLILFGGIMLVGSQIVLVMEDDTQYHPYFYTSFVTGGAVDLWLFVILLGFTLWVLIIANEVWKYLKAQRNKESEV